MAIDKTTGWATIIVLITLLIVIIVAAIWISFYYVTSQLDTETPNAKRGANVRVRAAIRRLTNKNRPLPNFNDDSTPGATNAASYRYPGNARNISKCGAEGTHSVKINGSCECEPGHWGLSCELQSYSHSFMAIGNVNEDQACEYESGSVQVSNLKECEEMCEDDCDGFYYRNNSCALLSEPPRFNFDDVPTFQPLRQADIYMKRGTNPVITDRVVLYEGDQPLRYWLGVRDNVIALIPGQLYHLPFLPDGWINDSGLDLAYSDKQFTDVRQAKFIQKSNQEFKTQLYQWVMAIPKKC
jgi:hypothetical protein